MAHVPGFLTSSMEVAGSNHELVTWLFSIPLRRSLDVTLN